MKQVDKLRNDKGQLVSFKDFADEYYSKTFKKTNFFSNIENELKKLEGENDEQNKFLDILRKDFRKIIKATPCELEGIISTFNDYEHILKKDGFGKRIEDVFKYRNFRKTAKARWFAQRFEIKACLYCNAQFTITTNEKLHFQFDHFYSQSKYPYLSLSLGNLIPVCGTCNNQKNDDKLPFHPFLVDINSLFNFKLSTTAIPCYLLEYNRAEALKKLEPIAEPVKESDSFRTYLETFNIEGIYKMHTDIIEEIVLKPIYYNQSKKEELKKIFDGIISDSDIDRFILGNYTLDSEINKRPLAKLTKDIGVQLKILGKPSSK
jgi:5-methylcytosine-specific restriction endonuclease McrA